MDDPAPRGNAPTFAAVGLAQAGVYAFLASTSRGPVSIEHLADMFVPIYMWRAARFMAQTAIEPADAVQVRLNALCDTFQRLKPALVSRWNDEV